MKKILLLLLMASLAFAQVQIIKPAADAAGAPPVYYVDAGVPASIQFQAQLMDLSLMSQVYVCQWQFPGTTFQPVSIQFDATGKTTVHYKHYPTAGSYEVIFTCLGQEPGTIIGEDTVQFIVDYYQTQPTPTPTTPPCNTDEYECATQADYCRVSATSTGIWCCQYPCGTATETCDMYGKKTCAATTYCENPVTLNDGTVCCDRCTDFVETCANYSMVQCSATQACINKRTLSDGTICCDRCDTTATTCIAGDGRCDASCTYIDPDCTCEDYGLKQCMSETECVNGQWFNSTLLCCESCAGTNDTTTTRCVTGDGKCDLNCTVPDKDCTCINYGMVKCPTTVKCIDGKQVTPSLWCCKSCGTATTYCVNGDGKCDTTCAAPDTDCTCDHFNYQTCTSVQKCDGTIVQVGNQVCCHGVCSTISGDAYKCDDGIDNDGDGYIDEKDRDCFDAAGNYKPSNLETKKDPTPAPTEGTCVDGADNDQDGYIDKKDKDCYDQERVFRPEMNEVVAQPPPIVLPPEQDDKVSTGEEEMVSEGTKEAMTQQIEEEEKEVLYRFAVEFQRTCEPWSASWARMIQEIITEDYYFAVIEVPLGNVPELVSDPCLIKMGDESGLDAFLREANRKIEEETQKKIKEEKFEDSHKDVEDFEFLEMNVAKPAAPQLSVDQISGFQAFVTPSSPAVQAAATGLTAKEIYSLVQGWTWMSDTDLHGEAEKWLTPEEFLTLTPTMAGNPLPGEKVSDCSEQANTLASMLRAVLGPENVRVAIGQVNFSGEVGGHAWVEVRDADYDHWFVLDPTNGPYYMDGQKTERAGLDYDYWKTHQYPFIADEVYAYYNDKYYTQLGGTTNAPDEWQVSAVIMMDTQINEAITKKPSSSGLVEEPAPAFFEDVPLVAVLAVALILMIIGGITIIRML